MSTVLETFVCNRTYNREWFKDIQYSNESQYLVIEAIFDTILEKDGGDFTHDDVLDKCPRVSEYISEKEFKLIPSGKLHLKGNGKGIRHVKYAPKKSVAILWEKIRDTIYVTFDDHAPIAYHRAIENFHRIRLGQHTIEKNARTSRKFIEKLKKPHSRKLKGVRLREKAHYWK